MHSQYILQGKRSDDSRIDLLPLLHRKPQAERQISELHRPWRLEDTFHDDADASDVSSSMQDGPINGMSLNSHVQWLVQRTAVTPGRTVVDTVDPQSLPIPDTAIASAGSATAAYFKRFLRLDADPAAALLRYVKVQEARVLAAFKHFMFASKASGTEAKQLKQSHPDYRPQMKRLLAFVLGLNLFCSDQWWLGSVNSTEDPCASTALTISGPARLLRAHVSCHLVRYVIRLLSSPRDSERVSTAPPVAPPNPQDPARPITAAPFVQGMSCAAAGATLVHAASVRNSVHDDVLRYVVGFCVRKVAVQQELLMKKRKPSAIVSATGKEHGIHDIMVALNQNPGTYVPGRMVKHKPGEALVHPHPELVHFAQLLEALLQPQLAPPAVIEEPEQWFNKLLAEARRSKEVEELWQLMLAKVYGGRQMPSESVSLAARAAWCKAFLHQKAIQLLRNAGVYHEAGARKQSMRAMLKNYKKRKAAGEDDSAGPAAELQLEDRAGLLYCVECKVGKLRGLKVVYAVIGHLTEARVVASEANAELKAQVGLEQLPEKDRRVHAGDQLVGIGDQRLMSCTEGQIAEALEQASALDVHGEGVVVLELIRPARAAQAAFDAATAAERKRREAEKVAKAVKRKENKEAKAEKEAEKKRARAERFVAVEAAPSKDGRVIAGEEGKRKRTVSEKMAELQKRGPKHTK